MWDHRNGNLLIDIEIELPTIGYNIGCYSVGDEVSTTFWFFFFELKTHFLLLQLSSETVYCILLREYFELLIGAIQNHWRLS